MKASELEQRLLEEGCNPNNFCIGPPRCPVTDIDCLDNTGGEWKVFYTERGQDAPPFFTTHDEAVACEFYFQRIMSIQHDHCVGFFRSEHLARSLMEKLEQHGLSPRQDAIPYGGWKDPRFRVFVTGKAIFKTREILGPETITDE